MQAVLDTHADATGVAGAQLSVVTPQGRVDVATGLADATAGRPMSVTTAGQVGSFAKVLTAVLVHQLVDDGHLRLTDLAGDVARAAGAELTGLDGIEVGQLLSMTSGLDWGIWVAADTVAAALAPQLALPRRAAPGSSFGYSFASTLVAARLVELIRRRPWAECVQEWIADPLALGLSAAPDPAHRLDQVAPGHQVTPHGWSLIQAPPMPGMGPTGTTLVSSAADLATLTNALCHSASPLLTAGSRRSLHEPVVPVGATMVADAWCRGPYSRRVGSGPGSGAATTALEPAERLHGHGGRWAGGVCDVTWNTGTGTSVAIVTNTPSRGAALILRVSRDIHRMLWGTGAFLDQAHCPVPSGQPDLARLTGRYVTANRAYDVDLAGDSLTVSAGTLAWPDAVFTLPDVLVELRQVGERRFLPVHETQEEQRLQEFWFGPPATDGRPEFFYDGFVGAGRERASATTAANAAGS